MPGVKHITIGLDTSSSPLLAVVAQDGKLYASRRKGIKQERILFPVLQKLLAKHSASLPDTKKVVIVRGPGRFTGIRIALTFASMLKYLRGAQVYGVTVFEAVKEQVFASKRFKKWQQQNPSGVLAVVLHAFRGEYFLQFFTPQAQQAQWLSAEELLSRLQSCEQPLFVAGADKERTPLDGLLGNRWPLADFKDCTVRADTLIALSERDDLLQNALEPLYLKPARFELLGK